MGFVPEPPIFAGDGVKLWSATDRNGKAFFKCKVLNGSVINLFKVVPKVEAKAKED